MSAAFATPRPARLPSTANGLLSELHDLSGLSLRQIEERTGVGAPRICLFERGTGTLRPEQFQAVERALRTDACDHFETTFPELSMSLRPCVLGSLVALLLLDDLPNNRTPLRSAIIFLCGGRYRPSQRSHLT